MQQSSHRWDNLPTQIDEEPSYIRKTGNPTRRHASGSGTDVKIPLPSPQSKYSRERSEQNTIAFCSSYCLKSIGLSELTPPALKQAHRFITHSPLIQKGLLARAYFPTFPKRIAQIH